MKNGQWIAQRPETMADVPTPRSLLVLHGAQWARYTSLTKGVLHEDGDAAWASLPFPLREAWMRVIDLEIEFIDTQRMVTTGREQAQRVASLCQCGHDLTSHRQRGDQPEYCAECLPCTGFREVAP